MMVACSIEEEMELHLTGAGHSLAFDPIEWHLLQIRQEFQCARPENPQAGRMGLSLHTPARVMTGYRPMRTLRVDRGLSVGMMVLVGSVGEAGRAQVAGVQH